MECRGDGGVHDDCSREDGVRDAKIRMGWWMGKSDMTRPPKRRKRRTEMIKSARGFQLYSKRRRMIHDFQVTGGLCHLINGEAMTLTPPNNQAHRHLLGPPHPQGPVLPTLNHTFGHNAGISQGCNLVFKAITQSKKMERSTIIR